MPTVSFDTEPRIPSSIPQGPSPRARAELIARSILAQAELRAKSFWATGKLIAELLDLRGEYGAANIKELCVKAGLGISHMTANKYLRISRTFQREMAVEVGIEKCYALIQFAKVIGRAKDAVAIWEADERINGAPRGVTAKSASAKQIAEAVKTLKAGKKKRETPPETTAKVEAHVSKLDTTFGLLRLQVHVEPKSRGGEPGYAIWVSEKAVDGLEARISKGLPRLVRDFEKHQPGLLDPLRKIGWAPKGRARATTG